MGRIKEHHADLPKRLRYSHGAYYHVDGQTWRRLSADKQVALQLHADIEAQRIAVRDIEVMQYVKPLTALWVLPPAATVDGAGVYFLWRGADLYYVGRSNTVARRIKRHLREARGTPHDKATALSCGVYASLVIEAVHIAFYRPPGNRKAF